MSSKELIAATGRRCPKYHPPSDGVTCARLPTWCLVAEAVVLLNRAMDYDQARRLAGAALSGALSPEQEAEIRLSLSTIASGTTQGRIEENRRRMVTHQRARTGWDSLTESELKVVHLVAEGNTNHAVAQKLHLSPHTVKTHLRNAYTKLGINSRIQLREFVVGSHHSSGGSPRT